MTERLHIHFSLSCIEEGNGNQLQCSCLENPRDGGVWWAAIYWVTQSWTRLKRFSSSSSSTVSPVTICHHTKTLSYIEYIPNNVHFILWLFYFLTGSLYLLISLTFHSCPHPHWQPPIYSLYLWPCFCFDVFVHVFFFRFHIFFNYSSIDRHLVYNHILGIVNNARSEISVLYASSILKLLRNLPIVFFSDCPIIHSHQQSTSVPYSPHPHQHFLFLDFLMVAILKGVRWYLIMVLICIFLMLDFFSCVCWASVCLLWKIIFEYRCLTENIFLKYIPPLSRLSFGFVNDFFCCANLFQFDVVPFVYSCFCFPCLFCQEMC